MDYLMFATEKGDMTCPKCGSAMKTRYAVDNTDIRVLDCTVCKFAIEYDWGDECNTVFFSEQNSWYHLVAEISSSWLVCGKKERAT